MTEDKIISMNEGGTVGVKICQSIVPICNPLPCTPSAVYVCDCLSRMHARTAAKVMPSPSSHDVSYLRALRVSICLCIPWPPVGEQGGAMANMAREIKSKPGLCSTLKTLHYLASYNQTF